MLFASIVLSSFLQAASVDAPKSQLLVAPCDVGEHWQFEKPSCEFELTNTGDIPIEISGVEGALAWDKGGPGVVVPPHGKAYVRATVDLRDAVGQIKRTFRFRTSEPGMLSHRGSSVYAFVLSAVDQVPLSFDFGAVKASGERPAASITVTSREVQDFRILQVLSKPDYLDVSLHEDGRTLTAKLGKDAPWGLLHEKIRLQTNIPQQKEVWVTVDANVIGTVAPSGNPYSLGLMRTNNKNRFLIRLTSDDGKDFRIGKVALKDIEGRVKATACVPSKAGCRQLQVDVSNEQARGRLQGEIEVELPEHHRVLPIQVVGMLLDPSFKVVDLNEEAEKSGTAQSAVDAKGQGTSPVVDIGQTLKRAISTDKAAPPPGNGPLLRWSVANEQSIYGYMIYRADTEKGDFVRINKDVVRVVDRSGGVGEYQWRDTSAVPGRTYWYAVDMVKGDGKRESLVTRQEVKAK